MSATVRDIEDNPDLEIILALSVERDAFLLGLMTLVQDGCISLSRAAEAVGINPVELRGAMRDLHERMTQNEV